MFNNKQEFLEVYGPKDDLKKDRMNVVQGLVEDGILTVANAINVLASDGFTVMERAAFTYSAGYLAAKKGEKA